MRAWIEAMNPLLSPSPLPFALPDYAQLSNDQFREAVELGMAAQREALEVIATATEPPTIANTIEAWELSSATLERAVDASWVAFAADSSPERDAIQAALAPQLAAHYSAIWLDERLYRRLLALRERADSGDLNLDEQDRFWLDDRIRTFESNGIAVDEQAKARLYDINSELAGLSVSFEQALVEGRNASAIQVSDVAELDGMEPAMVEAARAAAQARGLTGYLIDLTNTTGQPILANLTNRELRRKIYTASISRGLGGEHDVRELIIRITRLRAERAALLGWPHHAAAVAADGCAGTTENVMALLAQVAPGAVALANQEAVELEAALQGDIPGASLEPWDWQFYAAKLAAKTAVDPAELRPYLEYRRVLHDGVFAAATGLYGITFHPRPELRGFTEESEVFEVREADGSVLGAFIIDPLTRDSKRGGAWMTSIVPQSQLGNCAPVVTNTCNFARPADGDPILLTWDNVITLFHEFGHALHGLLSNVRYPTRSGTSVPRDFVEFPSQVNELWAWDEQLLKGYARHHLTGEPLPAEVLAKLRASQQQGAGYATLEVIAAMLLDQTWHTTPLAELPTDPAEVAAFEASALERSGVAHPLVAPRYRSCYFSHIFGSMYAASYYGYLWAEVLDADACAWFEAHGGLQRSSGEHYRRELLGRGGSIDAMASWRAFRGQEPQVAHLLRRKGLIVATGRGPAHDHPDGCQ